MLKVRFAEGDVRSIQDLLDEIPVNEMAIAVRSALETGQHATINPGGRIRDVTFTDTAHVHFLLSSIDDFLKHGNPSERQQRCLKRAKTLLYPASMETIK